jgi:hypothetical protein
MSWRENPHWEEAREFAKHWDPVPGIQSFVAGRPQSTQAEALGACITAYWEQARQMGMDEFAAVVAGVAKANNLSLKEALRASGNANAAQAVADWLDGFSAANFASAPLDAFGKGDWRLTFCP